MLSKSAALYSTILQVEYENKLQQALADLREVYDKQMENNKVDLAKMYDSRVSSYKNVPTSQQLWPLQINQS